MELLRRDEAARRWLASAFTDEVSLCGGAELIAFERGAVLVCAPGTRALVGGCPALAIALVGESEFVVGAERFRVREAAAPAVRSFDGGGQGTVCARCKTALQPGDAIVECSCKALLHEGARASGGEALLCFSYTAECPCGRPRASAAEDGADD